MEVKDKVVIITGASSGIGRALAAVMSAKGAKLALLARRENALKECALSECGDNPDVIVVPTDIADPLEVETAVKVVIDQLDSIDVLVNCAGVGYFGSIEKMRIQDFEKVVATNVYGLLRMTQASLPHLRESQGMIVNISSGLSKRALPFLSAYGGTKAMVDQISDGLRMELRDAGVRVLNYCPPEVATEFAASSLKGELDPARQESRRRHVQAPVVAAEIAKAIEGDTREVVSGGPFLKIMNCLAPRTLDNMFYKAMVVPMTHEKHAIGS